MPNWCGNILKITGDPKSISLIKETLINLKDKEKDDQGIFKALIGIQPNIKDSDYLKDGWYDANIDYWGAKWDVTYDENLFDFTETEIEASFETAWSPPINFGAVLSKQYNVKVELIFHEAGCDFAGKIILLDGISLHSEMYTYLEGAYILFNEEFWISCEHYVPSYSEDMSFDNMMDEIFLFVENQDDIAKLKSMYDKAVTTKKLENQ